MSKNLKSLIIEISELPFQKQEEKLRQTFDSWRGHNPQIDDVLITALKI